MISEEWKKIMEDPMEVLKALNKDFGSLRIREKLLPSEEAVRLNMLEKEKEAIIRINGKFAKTDYHTIYNPRVEKDAPEKVESTLNRYGIRLDIEEKRILLRLKKTGIPKLKAIVKEIDKIKKEVKRRYKKGEFGELTSIVKRGAENVALRKMHSNMLIGLGKERLEILKKIYEMIEGLEKKQKTGAADISPEELKNLAEAQIKLDARLKEINSKITLSEQAIKKYEIEAKKIVDEFVSISERIRQISSKSAKEMKQVRKEEGTLAK